MTTPFPSPHGPAQTSKQHWAARLWWVFPIGLTLLLGSLGWLLVGLDIHSNCTNEFYETKDQVCGSVDPWMQGARLSQFAILLASLAWLARGRHHFMGALTMTVLAVAVFAGCSWAAAQTF